MFKAKRQWANLLLGMHVEVEIHADMPQHAAPVARHWKWGNTVLHHAQVLNLFPQRLAFLPVQL